MCRTLVTGVAAALMMLASAVSGAQDVRDQAARVDAFARIASESRAHLKAHDDSVATTRGVMDSVSVGPFRVLMQPGTRELATRAAQLASDSLARLGAKPLERLARHQFVVRIRPARWEWERTAIPSVVVSVLDSQRVERLELWAPTRDAKLVAGWFYQDAIHLLATSFDSAFKSWLNAELQFDSVSAYAWTQFRLDLVSSPAPPARRCYEGDMTACRRILGLTPTQDPVLEWFDPASRRKIADRLQHLLRPFDRDATDRCLAGADSACISVLQRSQQVSSVMLSGHRVALVQLAIQMGGDEAVVRLFDAAGTPSERIAVTAGVSADSVLSAWHARIRTVRIPSDDMSVAIAAASLGWIGLLGILAFRNSRWR